MGFKFAFLGDLLSSLEESRLAKANLTVKKDEKSDFQTIAKWFSQHDHQVNHPDTDRLALLSCIFPEKRTDRVFWLQATSLTRVIGRSLGLGSSRLSELDQWRKPGGPDLGQCVENVMRQAENYVPAGREVSVEEIDEALTLIASRCRFSGPQVRRQHTAVDVETTLSPLYRRLSSRDAKWLTRMILKRYDPVVFPENYTMAKFHFLLPHLLRFQNTFEGALDMLQSEPMNHFPSRPSPKLAASLCATALDHLKPRTGMKVGRPEYFKARSIKNCVQMAAGRRMSVERKYDGEYCQIHIDLMNKQSPIQIFSKSGKDSTADRSAIAPVLEESLGMGSSECKFARRCILEGELVVWSDKRKDIVDFHKLRKFLSRSGAFIGVDSDSPPQPYEHLMIIFFDVLLLDDDACLRKPHRERRLLLRNIVQTIPGRAAISEQEVLRFDQSDSCRRLEVTFSNAIAQRWEGLVLKASDEPYFAIYTSGVDNSYCRWIKLKKDYIPGLGDTVDLALVGGHYDAQDATAFSSPKPLKWTHFLVACLLNKEDVLKAGQSPQYRVIDVVNRHCMHRNLVYHFNQHGEFFARNPEDFDEFSLEYGNPGLPRASMVFKKPFIVEMMGSGFEKPSGVRYYTLRFPRVLKVHADRGFEEAASFRELQVLSEEARSVPTTEILDERGNWCKRLKVGSGADQYISRSQSLSSHSSIDDESETDSSPNSAADIESEERHNLQSPELNDQLDQNSSQKTPSGMILASIGSTPAIHIDETVLASGQEYPILEGNVLTENGNLSQRQSRGEKRSAHAEYTIIGEKPFNQPQQATAETLTASDPVATMHPAKRMPKREEISVSGFLKSPLATIPVYLPGTPEERVTKTPHISHIDRFLELMRKDASKIALQQSNPHASSAGLAFGIFLIDPAENSLGREIHRMAKAVSQAIKNGKPCPSKGKIFFLDSLILQQDLCPNDPRFCLRNTWSDMAKHYYYACLAWGGSEPANMTQRSCFLPFDPVARRNTRRSRVASISFNQKEAMALGEYVSTNPPVHCSAELAT